MADEAIPYDSSRRALFSPAHRPPISEFAADWPVDAICAELSRLVYSPFEIGPEQEQNLAEILTGRGFAKPKCFNDAERGTQAFITAAEEISFLVFRGTQIRQVRDILSDAVFRLSEWRGPGRVHKGFLDAFLPVSRNLFSAIDANPRLLVTGHSLGAAMATLAAAELSHAELVTFGSPRVGDGGFGDSFAEREVRRYVDCCDLVTRVPPPVAYGHVGKARYIDRFGTVQFPSPDEAVIEADRRRASRDYMMRHAWRLWSAVPARSGADHAPINYVSAVLGRRTDP